MFGLGGRPNFLFSQRMIGAGEVNTQRDGPLSKQRRVSEMYTGLAWTTAKSVVEPLAKWAAEALDLVRTTSQEW